MPRKGFKSITVREEVYQDLWNQWQKQQDKLLKEGITSFSGFCTRIIYEALEKSKTSP